MRCTKCGNSVEALFYPRHTSNKPPKQKAFRCCYNCKIEHFRVVTSPGFDTGKMLEDFRNEAN